MILDHSAFHSGNGNIMFTPKQSHGAAGLCKQCPDLLHHGCLDGFGCLRILQHHVIPVYGEICALNGCIGHMLQICIPHEEGVAHFPVIHYLQYVSHLSIYPRFVFCIFLGIVLKPRI